MPLYSVGPHCAVRVNSKMNLSCKNDNKKNEYSYSQ